jgi:integrase
MIDRTVNVSPVSPKRRRRRKEFKPAELPKKAKRYTEPDPEQRGLYVRIPPQGPNSFVTVARDPYGKQVWTTLGTTDELTLDEARATSRAVAKRIKDGKPAFEAPKQRPDSFEIVAREWLKRHVDAKALRSGTEIRRSLEKYVLPHWGDREFSDIRRSDVTRLLDYIEDNHGAVQADRVLAYVRAISNWHSTRVDNYVGPFTKGMRRSDPKARQRNRILDDEELRAMWKHAEQAGTFGAFVRIALLTAQRRTTVASMKWADIDGDGVWHIPAQPREKENAVALKLPEQALRIIDEQPRLASNPYVFAGRGAGPINGFTKCKAALDEAAGVSDWVLHDLRRTARSLLSRAGVRPDIAERALGHAIVGVEAIYDRHSYTEEKADALRKLAALIEQIVAGEPGGNVVRMQRAGQNL